MKRLKAGPELKMPDLGNLRVPAFLEDLYYDLKDRRLLPLVALALVAIVAVPFLLSGGSDKANESPAPISGGGSASASGAEASLTVVRADPGLRDYRRRLRGRRPTDPFKQHFTAPEVSGMQLGSPGDNGFEEEAPSVTRSSTSTSTTVDSTESSTTTRTTKSENGTVTSETESHSTTPQQSGGGEEGTTQGSQPSSVAYTIDVKIKRTTNTVSGNPESSETLTQSKTTTRPKVIAPAPLPGEKAQVVTYMGVNPKTGQPLFLVSDEVTSVFGEAKCLAGTRSCQLLEIETGMPVTFVYGPAGDTYKMTVLEVEPAGGGES